MEWMSPMDSSFLHIENGTTPMHIGGVSIWARITRRSASQLNFQVDDPVIALIKSVAADPKRFS